MLNFLDNPHLTAISHSFSQVVLLENKWSGFFILGAIYLSAPRLALLAVLAVVFSYLFASYLGYEKNKLNAGLYGFSPVLIGIAAGVFFTGIDSLIVCLLGCFLCLFLTPFINRQAEKNQLPGLTLPFIVTTWLLILLSGSNRLFFVPGVGSLYESMAEFSSELLLPDLLLKGFGEIFLLDDISASIMILLSFLVAGWQKVTLVIVAALVSIFFGVLFGVDYQQLSLGMLTYNSILSFLAIDLFSVSDTTKERIWLYGFTSLLTIILDLTLLGVLGTFGLPVLTFPFVLATWSTLLFEKAWHQMPVKIKKKANHC
ncbi:urea transporter [Enterococcus casseliflavus]|uniref:urea transporter n=1 Tax=Enterococcus casseliflavus TaxID=37734 RepID=UPI0035D9E894